MPAWTVTQMPDEKAEQGIGNGLKSGNAIKTRQGFPAGFSFKMVGSMRLERTRVASLPPEDSVSANSTTTQDYFAAADDCLFILTEQEK